VERSNVVVTAGNALIVERQTFFVPYLRNALTRAGLHVSESRTLTALVLRLARPDTIVLGASGLGRRPLEAIRTARRECPRARIVVVTYDEDRAWSALAKTLGADTVLGPASSALELADAIRTAPQTEQGNPHARRTSLPQ
jgi:DNA-binding NarL/FixJ family response regulator